MVGWMKKRTEVRGEEELGDMAKKRDVWARK